MALTLSVTENYVQGNKRIVRGTVTFDSSYATGGESLLATDLGMDAIDRIEFDDVGGYAVNYDATNKKLKVFSAQSLGIANVNTTPVSSTTAAVTNTLITYALSAGALAVNGQAVQVRAWGTTTNTGGNKTISMYWGTTAIMALGAAGFTNSTWDINALIVRTGAATQEITAFGAVGATTNKATRTADTATLSGAINIFCTGLPAATADTITQTGQWVAVTGPTTGAGVEVVSAVDLSGLVVNFKAEGA